MDKLKLRMTGDRSWKKIMLDSQDRTGVKEEETGLKDREESWEIIDKKLKSQDRGPVGSHKKLQFFQTPATYLENVKFHSKQKVIPNTPQAGLIRY